MRAFPITLALFLALPLLAQEPPADLGAYIFEVNGAESPELFSQGYAFAVWLQNTDLVGEGLASADNKLLERSKQQMSEALHQMPIDNIRGIKQTCVDQVVNKNSDEIDLVTVMAEMSGVEAATNARLDEAYQRILPILSESGRHFVAESVSRMIAQSTKHQSSFTALAIDHPEYIRERVLWACNDLDLYKDETEEEIILGDGYQIIIRSTN